MKNLNPNASGWATVLVAGGIAVLDELGISLSVQNAALIIGASSLLLQYAVRYARWKGWLPPALVVLAFMSIAGPAQAEDLARITIASKPTTKDHQQFDDAGEPLGYMRTETGTAAEAYLAPMVTVSLVRVNLERRADYRAGVVPGVGYGFHWSPSWYDEAGDSPFISVGLFLEGGLQLNAGDGAEGTDYAVFTVLPAITVMRWFSVGVGYEARFALTQGAKDDGAAVLALGIASAF